MSPIIIILFYNTINNNREFKAYVIISAVIIEKFVTCNTIIGAKVQFSKQLFPALKTERLIFIVKKS